jgi:curved DNA-binding protein CbpA
VLELPRTATKDEIRRQYKKMALKYHPDKNIDGGSREHAERMFKAVARAYEVLSDDAARRQYDLFGDQSDAPTSTYSEHDVNRTGSHRRSQEESFASFGFGVHDPFKQFFSGGRTPPAGSDWTGAGRSSRVPPSTWRRDAFFDAFAFQDPFALFEKLMRDEMNFHSAFQRTGRSGVARHSHDMMTFGDDFGRMGFGMVDPFSHFRGASLQGMSGGSNCLMQSVSTVTEVRNGQRITRTVRKTQNATGVVTEDVDEQIENLSQPHGRPQLPPASTSDRLVQDYPSRGSASRGWPAYF